MSNRILGSFLIVFSLSLFYSFSRTNTINYILITETYPFLYIAAELNYLFGPLLYFYIKSVCMPDFRFRARDAIHIIPFFFFLALTVIKISSWYFYHRDWFSAFIYFDCFSMILQILLYLAMCVRVLRSSIKSEIAANDRNKMSWLLFLFTASILILSIKIILLISNFFLLSFNFYLYLYIVYFSVLFIFFYTILFYILKRPEIFSFPQKYERSNLTSSEIEEFRNRLLKYVEETKIYHEPALTLIMMSKHLSIPVQHLSRVINESFNINFSDFINRYRIEESKILLKDAPKNKMTVLEIVYKVGFNTKSAFYEAFKKHTGMTPKEFIKNHSSK